MTLPHHTREMPRPTQVIPIRVIKPLGKMAPAGIQDGANGPLLVLQQSRDLSPTSGSVEVT